jgi:hypothetical protein
LFFPGQDIGFRTSGCLTPVSYFYAPFNRLKTFPPKNEFMRIIRKSLETSSSVRCFWREPNVVERYSSAVSLHSHTVYSREGLDFVPRVLRRVPIAHAALERLQERCRRQTGKPIPFERAFWRPPLHPHAAYDLEAEQIRGLGLRPIISLTDHDTLEACTDLQAIGIDVPYSLEWTVPYHGTVFHVGVHNLPAEEARGLQVAMAAATAAPASGAVAGLLAAMHAMENVLVVLNHPFSCEERVDRASHVRLLTRFLGEFGLWIHALELNGLQAPGNNLETIRLAAERGMPVISGGDRHCLEPNANVNLTGAETFCEFVDEIRVERRSSVLFMPQYRDPIPARYIEFIWQAVRYYPEFDGRERWVDRVFFERDSGEIVPCRSLWADSGPAVIRSFISVIGFLASPGVRAMLVAMSRTGLEPEGL